MMMMMIISLESENESGQKKRSKYIEKKLEKFEEFIKLKVQRYNYRRSRILEAHVKHFLNVISFKICRSKMIEKDWHRVAILLHITCLWQQHKIIPLMTKWSIPGQTSSMRMNSKVIF